MLTADRFPEFFAALHGRPPFPWQARLAATVLEQGRWPDVLDLPTGAGKTSTLDIALYATAADPTRFPRRIVQVVDRRVVVDQGAEHARRMLAAIQGSSGGILAEVAGALRAGWGGDAGEMPFRVAVMRGAMPRDDAWARRPDQPVVALSTVDQAGSRLLFRGYGVSTRMAPVHAGLLGNDTLFLLDEVHLAVPFAETLLAIRDRWRGIRRNHLPDRWGVVRMSATPGTVGDGDQVLRLEEEDRSTPALARRLGARKRARLHVVAGRGKAVKAKLARECLQAAFGHLDEGACTVAVVVNRVDTARQIRLLLAESRRDVDAVLLTGRMRPLARDTVLDDRLLSRIGAGRARASESRPIVVVATQCIEVGADFDFDAVVTECAALDALLQRFGRLDRLGELGESRATVVVREDQLGEEATDPVYGPALARTWEWLTSQGDEVDLGIDHQARPLDDELAPLLAPVVHAPILLPAHLDAWVQTSPKPAPDPHPSLWLHGPGRGAADVQVIWRADLSADLLGTAVDDEEARDAIRRQLVAFPPGALEAVSVPIGAARRWLAQEESPEVADVVGATEPEQATDGGRLAVQWRGDASEVVSPAEVIPGDTLVVPSNYGGLQSENWAPEHQEPVTDLGDMVQWRQRGRAAVRLHPVVLGAWLPLDVGQPPAVPSADAVDRDPGDEIERWLRSLPVEPAPPWNHVLANLRPYRRVELAGGRWGLIARQRATPAGDDMTPGDEDESSFIACHVTLESHCRRVQEAARASAMAVGFPQAVAEDLALAGWLHDVGKADPRFQRMLAGGSEIRAALIGEPLAKSQIPVRDLRSRRIARERSGLPTGHRHELVSVALLEATNGALAGANDPDLVLYLISSHHGWGRPFAPAVDDPAPVEVAVTHGDLQLRASTDHRLARLDSGVADRFWSLVERYGWWGLAWLEAVFQLADHRVSEEEEVSG